MVQTRQRMEQDAKTEIETINQQATNALSVKVQENEQLQRENERMMREAQLVIQRKDQETMSLKSEAELALHNANQHSQVIQHRKIYFEFENNQDKDTIAEMNRNFHKLTEMRMQLQADFKKQNEAMMANIQSQAQLEMQKREANWQEQQQANQTATAMNKQIFQLQTDLQEQKNKNIPAPLLLGPSQNAHFEETVKATKATHLKNISYLSDQLLQTRVSAVKSTGTRRARCKMKLIK